MATARRLRTNRYPAVRHRPPIWGSRPCLRGRRLPPSSCTDESAKVSFIPYSSLVIPKNQKPQHAPAQGRDALPALPICRAPTQRERQSVATTKVEPRANRMLGPFMLGNKTIFEGLECEVVTNLQISNPKRRADDTVHLSRRPASPLEIYWLQKALFRGTRSEVFWHFPRPCNCMSTT